MKTDEYLDNHGLFSPESLSFSLPESFETISNLLKTIKEYRDYSQPDSVTWEEYVHEIFHILGFTTEKQEARLVALRALGVNGSPKALVGLIKPGENFYEIIPDLKWEAFLLYAASYVDAEWGILTNGFEIKAFNFKRSDYRDNYFWCNLEGIINNERLDSFFTLYKFFSLIIGKKIVTSFQTAKSSNILEKTVVTKSDYDLDHHTHNKPANILNLFTLIRSKILSLSNNVSEKCNRMYIGYSTNKNFCEIHIQRDRLKIWVDISTDKLSDPLDLCRDVSKVGHYGTGRMEMYIRSIEDVDNVFDIVKQAYNQTSNEEIPKVEVELTSRQIKRRDFWAQLLNCAKERSQIHANISPAIENWIGAGAGKSGLSYNYVVRMQEAQVELYIDRGHVEWNNRVFRALYQHRREIEEVFGANLDWQSLDDKRACRIRYLLSDYGLQDRGDWANLQDCMIDAMIRLHKALDPFIRQLS